MKGCHSATGKSKSALQDGENSLSVMFSPNKASLPKCILSYTLRVSRAVDQRERFGRGRGQNLSISESPQGEGLNKAGELSLKTNREWRENLKT